MAAQYVWSRRYIDAPVLRDRDSDGDGVPAEGSLGKADSGLDERLFYVTDANFNVTALVQGTPGDADLGKVVERYSCDPYGKVLVLDGADGVDPDTTAGEPDEEWGEDADGASDVANEILFCGSPLPFVIDAWGRERCEAPVKALKVPGTAAVCHGRAGQGRRLNVAFVLCLPWPLIPFSPLPLTCLSAVAVLAALRLCVRPPLPWLFGCFHRAFNSYSRSSMGRKKPTIPGVFSRVCARFDQKRSKSRAFCLTHFNIWALNRPWGVRIDDSGSENARFRGVRETAFSQSIERQATGNRQRAIGERQKRPRPRRTTRRSSPPRERRGTREPRCESRVRGVAPPRPSETPRLAPPPAVQPP